MGEVVYTSEVTIERKSGPVRYAFLTLEGAIEITTELEIEEGA